MSGTCELCGEPMPAGEEMFKFHGYSGQCQKPPKPKEEKNYLLDAVKAAYRKHHMGDDRIGWDELSEILFTALTKEMGDGEFNRWVDNVNT